MNSFRLLTWSAAFAVAGGFLVNCGSTSDSIFGGTSTSGNGGGPSDTDTTTGTTCSPGTQTCGCRAGNLCLAGLTCLSGICVNPNPSSSTTGQGGANGTSTTGTGSSATAVGGASLTTTSSSMVTSTSTGGPCNATPNEDLDKDGWTAAEGDCNDCDPSVNPGAFNTGKGEDCSGSLVKAGPCDTGLAIDDVTPATAAKAIDLCQTASATDPLPQKKWGVLNSAYVRANGTVDATPGAQVGILNGFGNNVHVQAGANMLGLSAGAARTPTEPNNCGSASCPAHGMGTPPPGFPQNVPNCPASTIINDDIGFQVDLRSPTNASGYTYDFKFYSFEFPQYVCTTYNDQFIALASPAPQGSINGNISFDGKSNPVSVNIAYFSVCDPASTADFASSCKMSATPGNCPTAPNPYCPSGLGDLKGTGFDIWGAGVGYSGGGATSWLQTQAPIKGGDEITLRFAIWNTGDDALYSSVLVDNFTWIVGSSAPVAVMTTPVTTPK